MGTYIIMSQIYARLTDVNQGYDSDKEIASNLDSTKYYEVSYVNMGSWITYITLVGVKDTVNSVNLEFYKLVDGEYVSYNIFTDPDFNPYLEG